MNNSPSLPPRTEETILRTKEVFVSAATIWELSIKIGKGKLEEPRSLIDLAEENGFQLLPVQPEHAAAIRDFKGPHRDPFDHLLLAQCSVEGLTLVTHDEKLRHYGVPVVLF